MDNRQSCVTLERSFYVHCHFANSPDGLHFSFGQYNPDETFECRLQRVLEKDIDLNDWGDEREASCDSLKALALMVRIAVFVALLSRDEDLITPIILSKDQNKHDETDETEADDSIPLGKTPRESIRKSQRFRILKRDGYRCQLCECSQADENVRLHVDHRVPLAKGGSNEDDNLWALCDTCNLGRVAHKGRPSIED